MVFGDSEFAANQLLGRTRQPGAAHQRLELAGRARGPAGHSTQEDGAGPPEPDPGAADDLPPGDRRAARPRDRFRGRCLLPPPEEMSDAPALLILLVVVLGLGSFIWFYERKLPSEKRAELKGGSSRSKKTTSRR